MMNWKNLKLSYKFFIAFGIIICLFLITGFWVITGIGGIVNNANEVIKGNKLRSDLESKYIDHLNWIKDVSKLFTDDEVTKLSVETNYKECKFGKWYYGEGRIQAEKLAPELKTLFDEFEEPHQHLHESAIKLEEAFEQMDWRLSVQINQSKSDYYEWADELFKNLFFGKTKYLNINKDPDKSSLGKVLESDAMTIFLLNHPENTPLVDSIKNIHHKIFNGTYKMDRLLKQNNGRAPAHDYYKKNVKGNIAEVIKEIDILNERTKHYFSGVDKANEIYQKETMVHLEELTALFDKTIELSKDYLMTDAAMLNRAKLTQTGVIIFILIATIIAAALAFFITKNLLQPIKKSVYFANKVAEGDLTVEIDIDQKDEIGQLAFSLEEMVAKLKDILSNIKNGSNRLVGASNQLNAGSQQISTGVNEQAAGAEEISSSMEEMTANIQQNAFHAKKALTIFNQSSLSIENVAEASQETVQAVTNINDKIKVISDIAKQTNILALNAAVEAARAGEQGRGFSVVAAEVRKLAEKSKQAAEEIVKLSQQGLQLSEDSNQHLLSIMPSINESSVLIKEIASASQEQEVGATQINSALQQFNHVTQQNATAAEEVSSSSEELFTQAQELDTMTRFFKVD
jgi:methyl-accepting chemotaxis protein